MRDYMLRTEHRAKQVLVDPDLYRLDVPGREAPPAAPHLPLTRDDFHAIPGALALRISWDNQATGARETWRVAYSGSSGWSVVRDSVGGRHPDWYGAVVTSPPSFADAVAFLTNCIAPGRLWAGANLTVDETV